MPGTAILGDVSPKALHAPVGRVAEVWRYPVKSIGGELLPRAHLGPRGIEGDRRWALYGADGKIGSGKTTRRFRRMPGLLGLESFTDGDGTVWVRFSEGSHHRAGDAEAAAAASELVGEQVELRRETAVSHFDDSPLHLVTTAELGELEASIPGGVSTDRRRFRPNLVVDAVEALVVGGRYRVGETAVVAVTSPTPRCVMVTMAQPGLGFAPQVLGHLAQHRHRELGVYADVVAAGDVAPGDEVVALV